MNKYQKYVEIIKDHFYLVHENAGGQGFRYFHCLNVAKICLDLAEKLSLQKEEREILFLAALFHDISKVNRVNNARFLDGSRDYEIKNNLRPHEIDSSEMVIKILKPHCGPEILKAVSDTIAGHDKPESKLQKILHDADELSEMGPVNLWKMFTYSSHKNRNLEDTIKYWKKEDRDRHILKTQKLYLDLSKLEGKKRIEQVDNVIEGLEDQINFSIPL